MVALREGEQILAALAVQKKAGVSGGQMAATVAGGAIGAAAYQAANKGSIAAKAASDEAMKALGVHFNAMVWGVTPLRLVVCKASPLTGKPSAFVVGHPLSQVELVEVADRLTRTPLTVKLQGLPVTVTAAKGADVQAFADALAQAIEWRRRSPL